MKTKITLLFLLFVTSLIAGNNEININQTVKSSYAEMTQQEMASISSFNSALRARLIDFNSQLKSISPAQNGETVILQLFNDKSYASVIDKVTVDINGTKTIRTKLTDYNYAYGVIVISGDLVYITIDIPELQEKYFSRIHPQTKVNYLLQLNPSNLNILEGSEPLVKNDMPLENEEPLNSDDPQINNNKNSINQPINNIGFNTIRLGVDDPAVIDIMIVYTPAAAAWASSNEGSINSTMAAAIDKANLASQNSDLGIVYNLVHSEQVTYTEVTASDDLDALTTNGDGIIDEVHTLRNTYAADVVVFFTLEENTGGLGWLLTTKSGKADIAFSISRVQQASWTYTTIHEMGHNTGGHHHKDQNTQPGPTTWTDWAANTWSAGWRWTGNDLGQYCSIMTYESGSYFADGISHIRVPYFSTPDFNYQGQPVGDAVDGNNALTLKETKHYVANYKNEQTLAYCEAGTNTVGYTSIFNVAIGSINQSSSYSSFSDFSFNSTDVVPGENYVLAVTKSSTSSYELIAWVDWNNDNDFGDANEQVYVSGALSPTVYTTTITVPIGTTEGAKRMRLRLHSLSSGPNSTPCGYADRGEVEDYTLNVVAPVSYNITFHVTDGTSNLRFAAVTCNGSTVETNTYGYAEFTGLPNGSYPYDVVLDGYTTATGTVVVNNDNATEEVLMEEFSEYNVTFIVTDDNGPVSGAEVVFNSETDYTDGNGEVAFVVPNETYSYVVNMDGYNQETGEVIVNGADENVEVFLTLQSGYTVTFHVTDGTSDIENADVTFDGFTINTDASGVVEFTDFLPGEYEYTVNATGFLSANGNVTVIDDNVYVNVVLTDNGTYTVYFTVSSGGSPLEGASVILNGSAPQLTDASGQTSFAGMANSTYSYSVTKVGYISDNGNTITVNGADVNKNVTLDAATYSVTFNVSDGTTPITGASVTFNGTTQQTVSGSVLFTNVSVGNAKPYSVSYTGYNDVNNTLNVVDQDVVENVVMGVSIPTTKLTTSSCGITINDLNAYIYCDMVNGAEDYQYLFTNVNTLSTYSYIRSSAGIVNINFCLGWVLGIEYGSTYNVQVRAKVSGVWGNYGDTCQIILNSIPNTKLATASCGITINDLNTSVYCNKVGGAEDYQYLFTDDNDLSTYSYIRSSAGIVNVNLCLGWIAGIAYGRTYNVQVRAKVSGVWGNYGDACQIILNGIPNTKLNTSSCGTTISNLYSSSVYCDKVGGAVDYQYLFTDVNDLSTYSYIRSTAGIVKTNLCLGWVAGLENNRTYNVQVKAKVGTTWGNYGTACQIVITGAKFIEISNNLSDNNNLFEVTSYPNPVNDLLSIEINSEKEGKYILEITDITGKTLLNEEGYIEDNFYLRQKDVSEYKRGIYFIRVIFEDQQKIWKFIKQ